MKAKDRINFVLACNATGTRKIPVAIIGRAKQPLCFKPPLRPCPLPFFSQTNAWMDGDHFKSWFETIFLVAVRARRTQPVALVSDNCGAHGDLESDQVKFFALPPNCTSIYQPLDLGIIACLKRRYKRRLLDLVVGAFEATLSNRRPLSVGGAAGTAGAARNAAAAGGRERAVDVGGASATFPTAVSTGEGAIVGDTGGTPRAAGPASASYVRRWLVRDGSWLEIDDRPPVPSSAAATAAVFAERRAARLAVRRAVRSAERRAARIVVRRAARSSARRAARIEVRRAVRNARCGSRPRRGRRFIGSRRFRRRKQSVCGGGRPGHLGVSVRLARLPRFAAGSTSPSTIARSTGRYPRCSVRCWGPPPRRVRDCDGGMGGGRAFHNRTVLGQGDSFASRACHRGHLLARRVPCILS